MLLEAQASILENVRYEWPHSKKNTRCLRHFISVLNKNFYFFLISGACFNFTSLSTANGSVLTDYSATSCLTIPNVIGVTPLLEIELASDCKNAVENNRVRYV